MGRPPSRGVETIAEVIDRLRAIDASLPASDGVAWFAKLYLRVTEAVEAQAAQPREF